MRNMTKLLLALAFPTAMLAAGSASAALITQWDYENISAFTAFTGPGVTGSNPNGEVYTLGAPPAVPGGISGSPTKLSWGIGFIDPTLQSSLVIDNAKNSGIVTTNGAAVHDLTLTHNNNVIRTGQTLQTTTLSGALLMQANTPPTSDTLGPLLGVFHIKFKETLNAGPCAAVGVPDCPDIFALDEDPAVLDPFAIGIIDGYVYFLQLILPDLQSLSAPSCATVSMAAGCMGFATNEGASNPFEILFQITAERIPVPEPGMLALLGLGLAGLGFAQKRSRK